MLFAISTPFPLVQQPVLVMPAQVGSFEKKAYLPFAGKQIRF
jgi:hypothetical protein